MSQASPSGTQCLQSVGCAEAGRQYERLADIPERAALFTADEIVYVSLGDGTTSEGEFWESLNTAFTRRLPVVYMIEDNGYAISVPVDVQTPGADISRLVESFPGLKVVRTDGTDFAASYQAVGEAIAWARARRGPALVHAKVIRPYSHSLSDDERLYKTAAEREAEAARDPLVKFTALLESQGVATARELADVVTQVEREVAKAADRAIGAPRPAADIAMYLSKARGKNTYRFYRSEMNNVKK